MAELELEGLGPAGQAQQLMPQADAEDGHFAEHAADAVLSVVERLGVAGAVAEEHAVGLVRSTSSAVAVPGRIVTRQPSSRKWRAMFHFMP